MEIESKSEFNIKKDFHKGDKVTLYLNEFDIYENHGVRKKISEYIIIENSKNIKIQVDYLINKHTYIDIFVHNNSGQLLDSSTIKILI